MADLTRVAAAVAIKHTALITFRKCNLQHVHKHVGILKVITPFQRERAPAGQLTEGTRARIPVL
jgi:hypothetical protein